jgi:Ca2+:H+ antiporter
MQKVLEVIKQLPKLSVLLVFIPVVIALNIIEVREIAEIDPLWLFIAAGLGILGTVTIIGKGTEEIAIYTGPLWGGLLNATFGNVTELIIALFALKAGLYDVVRASIIGSIIGNLLLILGGAMLYGGLKYKVQKFSRTGASMNVGMLWIVLITLAVPSFVHLGHHLDPKLDEASAEALVQNISLAAAVILLVLYALSLLFSLRTHRFLLMPGDEEVHKAEWSKPLAIGMLLGATLVVAYLSEVFVGSIEGLVHSGTLQISELFIGVIIVAIVGKDRKSVV